MASCWSLSYIVYDSAGGQAGGPAAAVECAELLKPQVEHKS